MKGESNAQLKHGDTLARQVILEGYGSRLQLSEHKISFIQQKMHKISQSIRIKVPCAELPHPNQAEFGRIWQILRILQILQLLQILQILQADIADIADITDIVDIAGGHCRYYRYCRRKLQILQILPFTIQAIFRKPF